MLKKFQNNYEQRKMINDGFIDFNFNLFYSIVKLFQHSPQKLVFVDLTGI